MTIVETGWAPSFIIEYLAVELILNAVETIVLLTLLELRCHVLPPEVLLCVKRVIRTLRLLFFVLLHPFLALLEEVLMAKDLAIMA